MLAAVTMPLSACMGQPSAEFSAAAEKAIMTGEDPGQLPSQLAAQELVTPPLAVATKPVEITDPAEQAGPVAQLETNEPDTAELQAAVSALQLLLDQEYQATLALDSELMQPLHTGGWSFGNHDYAYLDDLRSAGSTVNGHTPAQILSVLEATSLEPGRWLLTVLTSELSMEILTADGVHLLDTRDKGNLMATYEIRRN